MNLTERAENRSKALFTHSVAKLLCFQKGTGGSAKCMKAEATVRLWATKTQSIFLLKMYD